jgi:hypothetical protein
VQEDDRPPTRLHGVLELDDLALDGDFRHLAPMHIDAPSISDSPGGGLR